MEEHFFMIRIEGATEKAHNVMTLSGPSVSKGQTFTFSQ